MASRRLCYSSRNDSEGSHSMRAHEILNEKTSHGRPVICVDVQPIYADYTPQGYEQKVAKFLAQHRGPILMYVNADETVTQDNVEHDIYPFWDELFESNGDDFYGPNGMDKMEWFDKGYGYFRSWMDIGIERKHIIRVIREMYKQKINDSRELFGGDENKILNYLHPVATSVNTRPDTLLDDPLSVGWVAVDQLKRYNNCYLIGGARKQCLAEVAILMNAFNIKYTLIDSLIY